MWNLLVSCASYLCLLEVVDRQFFYDRVLHWKTEVVVGPVWISRRPSSLDWRRQSCLDSIFDVFVGFFFLRVRPRLWRCFWPHDPPNVYRCRIGWNESVAGRPNVSHTRVFLSQFLHCGVRNLERIQKRVDDFVSSVIVSLNYCGSFWSGFSD